MQQQGTPGPGGGAARGLREERGRSGGGAMPLAQLKEPWPLMELVPLDPEVSERGGGQAAAAGQPGSAQGRGGPPHLSAAPRGRWCPPVSSPLTGSTPLCFGCACAGNGSAGRLVPPCSSQEREPPT